MTEQHDREQVEARMRALADHLETELPADHGVMVWAYRLNEPKGDIWFVSSHADDRETLRLLWSSLGRLLSQEQLKEIEAGRPDPQMFMAPGSSPKIPRNAFVVSSATVDNIGGLDRLRIWARGALAGELTVDPGDGARIARTLGLVEVQAVDVDADVPPRIS